MRTPTIEIHGTSTYNRGAELMALAISERLRQRFPDCRIVVPPEFGQLPAIHAHGFLMSSEFSYHLINRIWWKLTPPNLKRKMDLVDPSEVDVVLDASGFSASDHWGPTGPVALTHKMSRLARKHQPLVLLPQAFGPFKSSEVARATRDLLERASLVFARDYESLQHLEALETSKSILLSPDFTLSLPPLVDSRCPPHPFAAIVPNARMIDKTSAGNEYITYLSFAADLLSEKGLKPVIVIHDSFEDKRIISRSPLTNYETVSHPDPRVLKWILSKAEVAVGSRFHALVSALSMGVPCIGVGWSHKYSELFCDFGCDEFLVREDQLADTIRLRSMIEELSGEKRLPTYRGRILRCGEELQARTEAMWLRVEEVVEASMHSRVGWI